MLFWDMLVTIPFKRWHICILPYLNLLFMIYLIRLSRSLATALNVRMPSERLTGKNVEVIVA